MSAEVVDEIFAAFRSGGAAAYLGEPVTLRQHMLQTAAAAAADDAPEHLVVAALLHDYGHLIHDGEKDAAEHGVDTEHEEVARRFLEAYFPPSVVEPVRLHVDAKRYLCAVDPSYRDSCRRPRSSRSSSRADPCPLPRSSGSSRSSTSRPPAGCAATTTSPRTPRPGLPISSTTAGCWSRRSGLTETRTRAQPERAASPGGDGSRSRQRCDPRVHGWRPIAKHRRSRAVRFSRLLGPRVLTVEASRVFSNL